MTKELAADVLICGAGAAGLTLAIDLAHRGVSFRLIDKMDGPFLAREARVFSRARRRSSKISASSIGSSQPAAFIRCSANIATTALWNPM